MITGQQIQSAWQRPIPAVKKLSWHEPFRHMVTKVINVEILGFRKELNNLYVYYCYRTPVSGELLYDSDVASQFKVKRVL